MSHRGDTILDLSTKDAYVQRTQTVLSALAVGTAHGPLGGVVQSLAALMEAFKVRLLDGLLRESLLMMSVDRGPD